MEKRRSLPQSSRRVTFLAVRFACSDRTKAEDAACRLDSRKEFSRCNALSGGVPSRLASSMYPLICSPQPRTTLCRSTCSTTGATPEQSPAGAVDRIGTIRLRHQGDLRRLAFSPDDKLLMSAGSDPVRLWDPATGKQVGKTYRTDGSVTDVAFSKDGDRLAIACWEQKVHVWDIANRRPVVVLGDENGEFPFELVRFSPDGKDIVICGEWDRKARISTWIIAKAQQRARLVIESHPLIPLSLSADGELATVSDGRGVVSIWSVPKGKSLLQLPLHKPVPTVLAFSPDSRFLITGGFFTGQAIPEL